MKSALRGALMVPIAMAVLQAQTTSSPAAPVTTVPVATVMLFSSGVGYFEHAGTVRGNTSTDLRFKTDQINDILKSLVVQDADGGVVSAITYPSQDPLAKTLRSFQVDITNNPSLADLLNQLRGARITVRVQAESLAGTILGVETHRTPVDKGEPVATPILNLVTGGTLRAVDLQHVTSLSLDDPALQDELTRALTALSQARDQDKKPVTIVFTGSGTRRVRVGYVVQTPIWKTSYRLELGPTSRLQGWAIVENQTESDWNNISLSLVSGRPISFVMDLYQPLYVNRPVVAEQLFAGLQPQRYAPGIHTSYDTVGLALTAVTSSASVDPIAGIRAPYMTATVPLDLSTSVRAVADASSLGDLFQFTIPNVTLARQKSAMLPIVADSVAIQRLSVYNASVLASNPLTGVRLTNTTGAHLLQGPVTVFDAGAYAGDARLDNVPPGQNRLLTYGIDLDMTVDNTTNGQVSSIVATRIVKGAVFIDHRLVATRVYRADNKGTKDRMLVIEHPIRRGWTLLDPQAPIETTPTVYRFQGKAPAGKVTVLTVKETVVQTEAVTLLAADTLAVQVLMRNGEIPSAIRDAISQALVLKRAVTDADRDIAAHTKALGDIAAEQGRIRDDMRAVDQSTAYFTRLLTKLNDQESAIEQLQHERDALAVKRDVARAELESYLATLTMG